MATTQRSTQAQKDVFPENFQQCREKMFVQRTDTLKIEIFRRHKRLTTFFSGTKMI